MPQYYYKKPYKPSDPKIKFRKCRECKQIFHYNKMEVNFMCKSCYTKVKGKKRCTKCYLLKPTTEYIQTKKSKDGFHTKCKKCTKRAKGTGKSRGEKYKKWSSESNRIKFYNNKRRCGIKNATIPGFEKQIKEIYDACPEGHSVDHIVPITHELVCGLNVPWNLQYLPTSVNIAKSNKLEHHNL